jgi:predicted transcriptional regulator
MENPHMETETHTHNSDMFIELTAEVVAAYVGNNPVSTSELPNLIGEVYTALKSAESAGSETTVTNAKPAVPVKKSLTDDYIICLEDGKKFKSLKRHLRSHFDLSPEEYREKWGLPHDYPMVAPNYAKARSQLAKTMGLGRKPGTKIRKRK